MKKDLTSRLLDFFKKYVNTWVIFVLDLIASTASSLVILSIMNFMSGTLEFNGRFALIWIISAFLSSFVSFFVFRTHHVVIRHSTLKDQAYLSMAILVKGVLMVVSLLVSGFHVGFIVLMAVLFDFIITVFVLVGMRVLMVVAYDTLQHRFKEKYNRVNLLVYGTSDKSVALVTRLKGSRHYNVLGFITPAGNVPSTGLSLNGLPVAIFSNQRDLEKVINRYSLGAVLFAVDDDAQKEQDGLIRYAVGCGLKVLISPGIDEMVGGVIQRGKIREINITDLLGREEIKISMDEIVKNFNNSVVMVTGAAGSIGSELCRQLASFGPKQLILYDNAETPMHYLRLELEERFPNLSFVPIIGDVRQPARLDYAFRRWTPQFVFHAAAYKHVPLMEENPCEAVLVNVAGSRNVADKCIEYGVQKMIMVSTDKAVNPTNVMGCTKRLAEIYVQSLGLAVASGKINGNTKFVTTRFGNVLGSNGSVIPRFRAQIEKGGPVTVTHPEINRFFMTIPEACRLVMEAATISSGNQIVVFDMGKPVKIVDLARRMIELAGFVPDRDIMIEFTGLRPGEKLYEEVLATQENTDETSHDRIRVAHVRDYSYDDACQAIDGLKNLAEQVRIPELVKALKDIVPEYDCKWGGGDLK